MSFLRFPARLGPRRSLAVVASLCLLCTGDLFAQSGAEGERTSLGQVTQSLQQELDQATKELADLQERLRAEKEPLYEELNRLESELLAAREQYQTVSRDNAQRATKVANLRKSTDRLDAEVRYLSGRLGEYLQQFQSQVHAAELPLYQESFLAANQVAEDPNLPREQAFATEVAVVGRSMERIELALGGSTFAGSATDTRGQVTTGTFALIGPYALFRSADGSETGTVESQQGRVLPSVVSFADQEATALASQFVERGEGTMPFDPTLGKAHQLLATEETWLEHIRAGGVVMWPIFVMAALALLVILYKWMTLALVSKPSRTKLKGLLAAVEADDQAAVKHWAEGIRGPVGKMLQEGVQHLSEPRELIEEVMYERVLTSRLKLQSFLPFLAICAAAAPLLGLLGTVTGIIDTFKAITVFGSGDVKVLSGGISAALITTEYGLIVAIPALLMHSVLSRKVAGIVGAMETSAVGFLNEVERGRARRGESAGRSQAQSEMIPSPALVRSQVHEILAELLGGNAHEQGDSHAARGGIRTQNV